MRRIIFEGRAITCDGKVSDLHKAKRHDSTTSNVEISHIRLYGVLVLYVHNFRYSSFSIRDLVGVRVRLTGPGPEYGGELISVSHDFHVRMVNSMYVIVHGLLYSYGYVDYSGVLTITR